jgi:hypothetical protein
MVLLLAAACAGRNRSAQPLVLPATADTGTVAITRPTLIGFHPVPTPARTADSGFVRTLAAFQAGLAHLRPNFERAGVAVYEQYTDTVVIEEPDRGLQIYVPPSGAGIGYYLVAPGRDPDIVQGLRPEREIEEAVYRYFHQHGVRRASR